MKISVDWGRNCMKRKLLLACVPALMILGSCAGAQPEVKPAEFIEDTLLHEEIFGDVSSLFGKAKRNALPDDVDEAVPAIGVQKAVGESYTSIRFIAATSLTADDLGETEAVWTRTMYDASGEVFKVAANKPSRKTYTALLDGNGTRYTIGEFNTKYKTSYNSFVVYTMLNIPNSTYDNYYLNAYLTLTGSSKVSNVLATNVAGNKRVSFPSTQEGYFLKGTINGQANELVSQTSDSRFEDVDMDAGDTFYVCYNHTDETPADSVFGIYGKADMPNNPYFEGDSASQKIKCTTTHSYSFNSSASNPVGDTEGGHTLTYTNNSNVTVETPLVYTLYADDNYQFANTISPKTNTQVIVKYDDTPLAVHKFNDTANFHDDNLYVVNGAADLSYWFKWYRGATNYYSLWLSYPNGKSAISATINGSPIDLDDYYVTPTGSGDVAQYTIDMTAGQRIVFIRGYDVPLEFPERSSSTSYYAVTSGSHTFTINSEYKIYLSLPALNGTSTVYFTNSESWSTVYAYSWDNDGKYPDTGWTGVTMTDTGKKNQFNQSIYSVSINFDKYDRLIIHGNNNCQTDDIDVSALTVNAFYLGDDHEWDHKTYYAVHTWYYDPGA